MDTLAIITVIGGIALLVALFGGGIKAKEIEIPSIPGTLRILSGLAGIVLIGMAVTLSSPNPILRLAITPTISTAVTQPANPTTQSMDQAAAPTTQPIAQSAAPTTQSIAQPAAPTTQPIAQPNPSDLLFVEDFEDGKADDFRFYVEDWQVIDDGSDNKVFEANNPDNPASAWTQADFGPVTLSDYSIEYRLRLIEYDFSKGTDSGSTSLLFRQGSAGSYVFVLNPYQHQIELNFSLPNGSWEHFEEEQGVRPYDFQKNVWYTVRIEVYRTQIKAFLDGNLMFTFDDSRLKDGGFAFQRAPDMIVQFDDVRVMK